MKGKLEEFQSETKKQINTRKNWKKNQRTRQIVQKSILNNAVATYTIGSKRLHIKMSSKIHYNCM